MESNYYIGVNSGTSLDKIDCALFNFDQNKLKLIDHHSLAFPTDIAKNLKAISSANQPITIKKLGEIQTKLAYLYADGIKQLLAKTKTAADSVTVIGCHGQTVFHSPISTPAYTMQLNNGAIIAKETQVDTVTDFRSIDMAFGGQGAPLAPGFHEKFFYTDVPTAVINLGGIANITFIHPNKPTIGFDTGPANCLMDMWMQQKYDSPIDKNGQLAASGKIIPNLLQILKQDCYFNKPAPKSTGVDYFNLNWLTKTCGDNLNNYSSKDIQATLCELSVVTIRDAIINQNTKIKKVYLCGGGTNNNYFIARLKINLPQQTILKSDDIGIPHDWVECACFAWYAKQHIEHKPTDLRSITGAQKPCILGCYYPAA